MNQTLRQRVRIHDRYQLEFKFDYNLLPGKQTRYRITTYIFLPQRLGINPETYPRSSFYADVQNYVRLKTPVMSLDDLVDDARSPLNRIAVLLQRDDWSQDPAMVMEMINSFKFGRAILKSTLRDLMTGVRSHARRGDQEQVLAGLDKLLVQTAHFMVRFRNHRARLARTDAPSRVQRSYVLTDEALSILVEETMVKGLRVARKLPDSKAVAQMRKRLAQRAEAEKGYRRQQGMTSILTGKGGDEEYMFRSSVLKKFTSSVLYLATSVRREGVTLEQMVYAVAAGLSMIFATVVAFFFQSRYGNFTFPFFVALVVGYMFKDRIKEAGRSLFAGYLRNYLFDRRIELRTMDGEHALGYLREKVGFVPESQVPDDVLAVRDRQYLGDLDNDGQGEQVVRYVKEVVLYRDAFRYLYLNMPDITGINDILRLDVRPYLRKMADPIQRKVYVDGGQMRVTKCHKLYTVNFVVAYQNEADAGRPIIERTRAFLDRDGLVRVQTQF